jgi:hypothetical protein
LSIVIASYRIAPSGKEKPTPSVIPRRPAAAAWVNKWRKRLDNINTEIIIATTELKVYDATKRKKKTRNNHLFDIQLIYFVF